MQTKKQAEDILQAHDESPWTFHTTLAAQRHTHRYTCGHAHGLIHCYEADCPDPAALRCATCVDTPTAARPVGCVGWCPTCQRPCPRYHTTWRDPMTPLCGECGTLLLVEDQATPPPPLDYHRQEYEPNPQAGVQWWCPSCDTRYTDEQAIGSRTSRPCPHCGRALHALPLTSAPTPTPRQVHTLAAIVNLERHVVLVLEHHVAEGTYQIRALHGQLHQIPLADATFWTYDAAYTRLLAEAAARREP